MRATLFFLGADYAENAEDADLLRRRRRVLHKIPADTVRCPMIAESPVNIECQVTEINELGSHHMFLAKVTAVHVDDAYIDEKGTFHLNDTGLLAYSHGTYHELAKATGNFGYSVRKTHGKKQKRKKR